MNSRGITASSCLFSVRSVRDYRLSGLGYLGLVVQIAYPYFILSASGALLQMVLR